MSRSFYTSPLMQESRRGSNVRVYVPSCKTDDSAPELQRDHGEEGWED
jgi:hypothetical protein